MDKIEDMISCIICSRTPVISHELWQNIDSTIGIDHEIIVIDNSHNSYSIFSAYNEGVSRARGDVLCFMHEDVFFRSTNWGGIINRLFEDGSIGLVGIAGCHFLPSVPSYWVSSSFVTTTNIDYVEGITYRDQETSYLNGENIVDAVSCDGQWFCIRKPLFKTIRFDEDCYNGFHMYDMDICMQVLSAGYRVCISGEIVLEHHSRGNYNKEFEDALHVFFDKWKHCMPITRGVPYISDDSISRINHLYQEIYALEQDLFQVRHSYNYRIGYYLLKPIRFIVSCLKRR